MRKNILNIIILSAGLAFLSCNKASLTNLNTPLNSVSYPIPANLFTNVLVNTPRDNYGVIAQGMQYFSTYKEVPAIGDKYYSFNGTDADFSTFTGQLNTLYQLNAAIQDPALVNQRALVRILRVYTFHQLTDVAGDIPYSEALKGEAGTLSPKYDTQRDIYLDMFKELDESATALDATKTNFGTADIFYKGDVTKWKKFAYSLMLRLGMRLTQVEPALAQTWVQKAIAGGVITTDADMAKVSYANVTNGMNTKVRAYLNGNYLNPQDPDNVEGGKYAATFINKLKSTNDPRLPVISVVWVKPAGATAYVADNTPALQKGMTSGSLNTKPLDFDTYSEPSQVLLNLAAPIIIMGPAEANLLLAEAALRGWYTGATAKVAYENGVRSGMTQWAQWASVPPASSIIPAALIEGYITANPYLAAGTFDQQLQQISEQKWLSLFGDDYEVFANWRRTRYPILAKVNYPGNVTGGNMFRRFALPVSEKLLNATNYQAALTRQGFLESTADNLLIKVWWDKP